MSAFDAVAATFDRERGLPPDVPAAIRRAVVENGGVRPDAPILEVGCGTGRIGAAFCAAGDPYTGVDLSAEMLRAFRARSLPEAPALVHADAGALPFGDGVFAAVLLMHVLTAASWRTLLIEARRVLRRRGLLVIGKSEGPADGIDAVMRERLNDLLAEWEAPEPAAKRDAVAAWLGSSTTRRLDVVAASWETMRMPHDFFRRKRSAARFGLLPEEVREAALHRLAEWARQNIGPLDVPRHEVQQFRLQFYWF